MAEHPPSPTGQRLAFIITELEVGGAERCLTQLALGIDRERYRPVVYSLWNRPRPEAASLVAQLEDAAIPVRFAGLRHPRQLFRGSAHLRRLLAEQQPTIVQTFLFHANVLGTWTARLAGSPKIVQGIRVADPSPWRRIVERVAARRADRIVCVSQSVAAFAREQASFPAEKLLVIPNGLDVAAWDQAAARPLTSPVPWPGAPPDESHLRAGRLPPAGTGPFIAVVGRLHPQKGLDWLLRVLPRLVALHPQLQLALIGQGPQQAALAAQVHSLGLERHVVFWGWRPDIPALLRLANLLVLPSRWEGMPNVLLEAMAAQLPVVATDVEGVGELLGDSPDQRVPFGDDDRLFAAIASILRDSRLSHDLGRRNRRRVETEFSLRRMIADYETLYASLMNDASTSGMKKSGGG